jgi:ribosomal-protein-serine acetyltransferase
MRRFDLREGVEVREWDLEDAEAVFAEVDQNRERLRDWLPWVDATRSPDDIRAFLERCAASDGKQVPFGIYVDGVLAGNVGLTLGELGEGELGYWIGGSFEGRGLVTRASRAILGYAFEELGLRRMQLCAAAENLRSRAVAERLGMTQEGVLRRAERIRDDRIFDTVVYSILADEWPAAPG